MSLSQRSSTSFLVHVQCSIPRHRDFVPRLKDPGVKLIRPHPSEVLAGDELAASMAEAQRSQSRARDRVRA